MSSSDLDWIKAKASLEQHACVELAVDGPGIVLRNSRDIQVQLHFTYAEIAAFIAGAKAGEFDQLLAGRTD